MRTPQNREARRNAPPEPLLDLYGAADYLGVTHRHMRDLVYRRRVPFVKVQKLVRFRRSELDAWLDASRTVTLDDVVAS